MSAVSVPDVCVVVPTYNRATSLGGVLEALEQQTLVPDRFEVVVVDDCSTDGTATLLDESRHRYGANVRVLRTSGNTKGPAAPRNLGWQNSSAPIIAFLDDDCRPTPNWLEAGLDLMLERPELGVVQGRTITPPSVDVNRLSAWHVWRTICEPSPWFEAVNIFYRRAALDDVGGFDERMPTWGEDTDLGWRVVEAGWQRGFAEEALAFHDAERRGWRWWLRIAWLDRNLVYLGQDHPQFRAEAFWRRHVLRREDMALLLASAGGIAARRWRSALLLSLPYLWWQRPCVRCGGIVGQGIKTLATDFVRLGAHLSASLQIGDVVL